MKNKVVPDSIEVFCRPKVDRDFVIPVYRDHDKITDVKGSCSCTPVKSNDYSGGIKMKFRNKQSLVGASKKTVTKTVTVFLGTEKIYSVDPATGAKRYSSKVQKEVVDVKFIITNGDN